MRNIRVCTVKGKDKQGSPKTVKVDAYSVYEAAARGLHEIMGDGFGMVSDLEVTEHTPGKYWKVSQAQLLKWVSKRSPDENLGLQAVKRTVKEILGSR